MRLMLDRVIVLAVVERSVLGHGNTLNEVGFDGVIAIERDAGEQRVKNRATALPRLMAYEKRSECLRRTAVSGYSNGRSINYGKSDQQIGVRVVGLHDAGQGDSG